MTASPVQPPHQAPPKPAKFGALAWSSLILGIVGILGSPIIFLNNVTAIAAGLGLILGIIALFGTKKILALIGVGLCIAAIAITVSVQNAMVEEIDEIFNEPGSASADDADGESAEPSSWGDRFTWRSGVAVEVSKPSECQPGEYAHPTKIDRAVKVTVTVVNGSDEPVDTIGLAPTSDAVFNDNKAEAIFDSEGDCGDGGMEPATVRPGKTYSFDVGYAVGSKPGELQVVIDPILGQKAIYVGKA